MATKHTKSCMLMDYKDMMDSKNKSKSNNKLST
jgi:hypothetical protein